MNKVKIKVGGAMESEASRRFVGAWHRAERGETSRSAIWPSRVGMPSPES